MTAGSLLTFSRGVTRAIGPNTLASRLMTVTSTRRWIRSNADSLSFAEDRSTCRDVASQGAVQDCMSPDQVAFALDCASKAGVTDKTVWNSYSSLVLPHLPSFSARQISQVIHALARVRFKKVRVSRFLLGVLSNSRGSIMNLP